LVAAMHEYKETIYRGRVVTLKLLRTTGPRGPFTVEIVEHPGAVVILPFLNQSEVVVIRQLRHAVGEELIELPAGTLERGETPRECALRELEEETGYKAGKIEYLGSFYASPGYCTELLHAFVARDLRKGETRLDLDEEITVGVMSFEKLVELARSGAIKDAKTLATLALYVFKHLSCYD